MSQDVLCPSTKDHDKSDGKVKPKNDKKPSTVFQPDARASAFQLYNATLDFQNQNAASRPVTFSSETYKSKTGFSNSSISSSWGAQVPSHCGHKCCCMKGDTQHKISLLGPEFVDFLEPPRVIDAEFSSLTEELFYLAWMKSQPDNGRSHASSEQSNSLNYAGLSTDGNQPAFLNSTTGRKA